MIWGLSFVFQKEGMEHIEAFTFNGIRMLIGSVSLLPVLFLRRRKKSVAPPATKKQKKQKLTGILIIGLLLCISTNIQQMAFNYLPPGKIGFITALYMLFVPIFDFLIFKKKISLNVWVGVILGVAGLYLLCAGTGFDFNFGAGEIMVLICAVLFALHIIAIDYFASDIDSVELSCGQFFVAGIVSCVLMFLFENPDIHSISHAAVPLLYAGIMSCGVAFTFQIIGQKYTEPTLASMLLCLESVFSVLFSLLILHTEMSAREYIGCAVMFGAIILAQLPSKTEKQSES
ncbi:MAG: DMT family transporter [Clostridia bacterium]|nr:DMT family transporter [Clostridia bacterium]